MSKLNVSEIFQGFQGEGKYVGLNSVFLRLSGCNLNCKYCDTQYHKKGIPFSTKDIAKEIKSYETKNLIITGGEPLLQQKGLKNLLKMLPNYFVIIETNGSIMPEFPVDHFSVSPKLSSSENDIDKRMNYDVLEKLNNLSDSIFKFVISKPEKDLEEIAFIQDQIKIKSDKIYLMKEGCQRKDQIEGMDLFLETVKKLNYNFSPRIHIMIYGEQRKV